MIVLIKQAGEIALFKDVHSILTRKPISRSISGRGMIELLDGNGSKIQEVDPSNTEVTILPDAEN